MLSQDRSFHPSKFVYIRATTTHRRHRTENSASVMTESLWKKREVDIISRYKWWINEELHRWSFDKPLIIVYHWYLKYLFKFNSDIFLGDCATFGVSIPRGRRFHSRKYVVRKISIGIYFHISTQYKPIIGRISACQSWYLNKNYHFPVGDVVFATTDFFFFIWAIIIKY